jgi:hypothetical protein
LRVLEFGKGNDPVNGLTLDLMWLRPIRVCSSRCRWIKQFSMPQSAVHKIQRYRMRLETYVIFFNVHGSVHRNNILIYISKKGPRGSAVDWGTALQSGRSRVRFLMVSLEFFIHIILPAALWPWSWLSL